MKKALRFFIEFHCLPALRIVSRFYPVLLVFSKAREGKESKGYITCPFMGHEITMVCTAEFFHQGYPHSRILLKLFELERINGIAQVTGNHLFFLHVTGILVADSFTGVAAVALGYV